MSIPYRYQGHGWRSAPRRPEHRKGSRRLLSRVSLKNLLLLAVALALGGSIFILAVFAFVSRNLPDPNSLSERLVKQSTKIYDRTGEHLLYEIFNEENRTLVKMQEGLCPEEALKETDKSGIPLMAIQATIAPEDRKFCSHHGFSFTGFSRAVVFGGTRGGGSTL